jgi:uncharacterized protein (TIGR02246 family)
MVPCIEGGGCREVETRRERIMSLRKRCADAGWRKTVTAVAMVVCGATVALSAAKAAPPAPIEATLRTEAEATVKAFNAADAAALANGYHEAGELVDEDGNVYSGRAEIAAVFKKFFERFPQAVLEMEVSGARPIGETLAVEEGVRRITAEAGAAAAQMRYVAVRLKQGEKWPIVSYREFADDPLPTPPEMLAAVEWLVGEWVDESDEGRTTISYRWSEDGNFIIGEYNLTIGGKSVGKSTQRIGWDPVEGELRSWTFDSDGGFAEGEWAADGAGWIIKSEATMPNGSTGSATVTITPKDPDHFVVESTDRIVGGSPEPDFKLVVARKPPAPAAAK